MLAYWSVGLEAWDLNTERRYREEGEEVGGIDPPSQEWGESEAGVWSG